MSGSEETQSFAAVAAAEAEPVAPSAPAVPTTLSGIERVVTEEVTVPDDFYRGAGWRNEVSSRLNNYRARRRGRSPEGAMQFDFANESTPACRSAAAQRVVSRYANRPSIAPPPFADDFDDLESLPPAPSLPKRTRRRSESSRQSRGRRKTT